MCLKLGEPKERDGRRTVFSVDGDEIVRRRVKAGDPADAPPQAGAAPPPHPKAIGSPAAQAA